MKLPLKNISFIKNRVQRNVLSQEAEKLQDDMCAPPSYDNLYKYECPDERASLCTFQKGSLTVEAALILPFFLVILLAFFSFFSLYASAADLKLQAAAEAKKVGIVLGCADQSASADVTIYKTSKIEERWLQPFRKGKILREKAVCRAWIGFTELDTEETYVYITPEGEVYHLFGDCTHLKLSVRRVSTASVHILKNDYGQTYRKCESCEEAYGGMVYITSEGECYHSERTCSGLKRTIRQIPLSQVGARSLCIRCMSREEQP